ncbi:hypothetical protein BJ166DRAFT_538985 [Pestalotiopsis sp. NC0098]|nr:hypothetical protein BJ166DRAFT_538985 [Pestalotiopsis sp. NC0098]
MATSNCSDVYRDRDYIPANLEFPTNVSYVLIPILSNASYPSMQTCCAPNPVNQLDDCWLWCQVAESSSDQDLAQNFSRCLSSKGNATATVLKAHVLASTATRSVTLTGMSFFVLLVGSLWFVG